MLSGLLKNNIAIQVSINIMNAFVEMKKFLMLNGQLIYNDFRKRTIKFVTCKKIAPYN